LQLQPFEKFPWLILQTCSLRLYAASGLSSFSQSVQWHLDVQVTPAFRHTQYFFLQLPFGQVQKIYYVFYMAFTTFIDPLIGKDAFFYFGLDGC
jgi:hypothetical protein